MRIDQIEWQPVLSCAPEIKVSAVRELLDKHGADGLLLVDGGLVVGCLDRSDLSTDKLSRGALEQQAIGPYAHGCPFHVTADMDVASVLTRMRRYQTPMLPVKAAGRIVGMVSRTQLAQSEGTGPPSKSPIPGRPAS